jgi:hypothetical protein
VVISAIGNLTIEPAIEPAESLINWQNFLPEMEIGKKNCPKRKLAKKIANNQKLQVGKKCGYR